MILVDVFIFIYTNDKSKVNSIISFCYIDLVYKCRKTFYFTPISFRQIIIHFRQKTKYGTLSIKTIDCVNIL